MTDRTDGLPGFNPDARKARAKRIPVWRWILWQVMLMLGMLVFYVGLTPIWIGMRGAAWMVEFKSRRRRKHGGNTGNGGL